MRCRFVLLGSFLAGLAAADPLTITISGTGSGTLGGKAFNTTAFTVTLTTDTKLVVKPPCCDTRDTPAGTAATFSIAGVGSGALYDDQSAFAFPSGGVIGLAHFNGVDLIDLSSPAISGYTLNASIGPITGVPAFVGTCPGSACSSLATSLGYLSFNQVASVTFTVVAGTPAPPAPVIAKVAGQAAAAALLTPGMPIEITGTGFGTGPADAATATIAGRAAPVLKFINSTDVVVQVPVDAPLGAATVTVTYKGVTSGPFNVTLEAIAPQIFRVTGSAISSCYDPAGIAVTEAHPGIPNSQVYCLATGLGPTSPPQATNTTATAPSPATSSVQVMVGGKSVRPDYAGLFVGGSPGTFQVLFRLPPDVPSGNQPVQITAGGKTSNTVTIAVAAPIPLLAAIVNAATFQVRGAAPNSFISIFGANFGSQDTASNIFPARSFNGVSVLFNSTTAPLYFVFGSAGQMNLVVPSELPESGTVKVQVRNSQGLSSTFFLQMADADVGMFRIPDPSNPARNNGAVLFANTAWRVMPASMAKAIGFPSCAGATPATVCGQPAAPGDSIAIFLTGLGKATPNGDPSGKPLATGSIAPVSGSPLYRTVQIPAVTIGGIPTPVGFSGIAPGNAGLYQLNLTIPAGVQPGDDVPVVVTTAGGSTDTVTIAVRAN